MEGVDLVVTNYAVFYIIKNETQTEPTILGPLR